MGEQGLIAEHTRSTAPPPGSEAPAAPTASWLRSNASRTPTPNPSGLCVPPS